METAGDVVGGGFGFTNGDYVCFSIETRKEKGEDYSAVKGLFRQFELVYVAADERDLVRLRTNYRQGEEAYLLRLNGSTDHVPYRQPFTRARSRSNVRPSRSGRTYTSFGKLRCHNE